MAEKDERTIGALAREALQIQDACNLSGLAHSFPAVIGRLRELRFQGVLLGDADTHPIVKLWVDKLASLAGTQGDSWAFDAYRDVQALAVEPAAVEPAVSAEAPELVDAAADTQPAAPSFEQTLAAWVERSQARIAAEHARAYPNSKQEPRKLTLDAGGVRYVRVVATDGPSRSAFAFIERATGDVLKAESWKRPAKGARGNIYTDPRGVASSGELYR